MLLADELLLLALDDTSGKSVAVSTNLDVALAAALLVDLALQERISVAPTEAGWRERGKVTVVDSSPTDDPDLDEVLARLVGKDGQKAKNLISPVSWRPIYKGVRDRRLARLIQGGVLTEQRTELLGLRRYPTRDPRPEQEVRVRLRSALVNGLTPTERTVALIALLSASRILPKIFPAEDKKLIKTRAKRLSEGDWAAKAVRDAITEASG